MNKIWGMKQIVEKLIGFIIPVGSTHEDDERFDNLKDMCHLVEGLIEEIEYVSNDHSHEYSVKRAQQYAEKFLKAVKDQS